MSTTTGGGGGDAGGGGTAMPVLMPVLMPVPAAAFALAGAAKLVRRPSPRLMPWVEDIGPRTVRLIGVAEIAGATALLLPPLRVLAAGCLGALMSGGIGVHLQRRELLRCAPAVVLLGGCVAVVAARQGTRERV